MQQSMPNQKMVSIRIYRKCLFLLLSSTVITIFYLNWTGEVLHINEKLIDTPGYSLPYIKPWDQSIAGGLLNQASMPNCSTSNLPLTSVVLSKKTDYGTLVFHRDRIRLFTHGAIQCCYRPIIITIQFEEIDPNNFKFDDNCIIMTDDKTIIPTSVIYVRCWDGSGDIYANVHYIPLKENLEKLKKSRLVAAEESLSVLIIGLEALSRNDFMRYLPQTFKTLYEIDAIDLLGFNKVDDIKKMRLWKLLTSPDVKNSFYDHCKVDDVDSILDECKIIWSKFRSKGYITLYGDDSQLLPTKNYFGRQPTDVYFNSIFNIFKELGKETSNQYEEEDLHKSNLSPLVCNNWNYDFNILDILFENLNLLTDSATFSVISSRELTKSEFYLSQNVDIQLSEIIQNFKSDKFNNTIVILVSEFGRLYRPRLYSKTFASKMEHRLPFSFLVFPEWFKIKYSLAYAHLKVNQKRLTTVEDLYYTLIDILYHMYDDHEYLRSPSETKAMSLFKLISNKRTCTELGISLQNCASNSAQEVPINSEIKAATAFVFEMIKTDLEPYDECDFVDTYEIITVYKGEYDKYKHLFKEKSYVKADRFLTFYNILLTIEPGRARIEVTILVNPDKKFELAGPILIAQTAMNNRHCIQHYLYSHICSCRLDYE